MKVLDLSSCKGLGLESIQLIVRNCVELRELNLEYTKLSRESISLLSNELTTKVRKIFWYSNFQIHTLNLALTLLNAINRKYVKLYFCYFLVVFMNLKVFLDHPDQQSFFPWISNK